MNVAAGAGIPARLVRRTATAPDRSAGRPPAGAATAARRAPSRPTRFRALAGLLTLGLGSLSGAEPAFVPRMLLLDGVVVGSDVIAVGERGTILRSADQGATWRRLASPTRAALTGVTFATLTAPQLGWAVGHDATILHTRDGGQTWVQQFQGENLQDSLLDVLALDAQRVLAVGAYGLALATTDGGKTWRKRTVIAEDVHLNRLSRGAGGILYLAGERGTLLRSADQGETWQPIPAPYEGSFYGILPLDRGRLAAYGLRGHVFLSDDDGASWRQLPAPAPVLLATGVLLRGGALLFAGQARALFIRPGTADQLTAAAGALPTAVSELLELPDGRLLALGEAGATLLPAP